MQWTEAQREAIETRRQRVLVSAGAGSGKTRVLVERFLRLLEENPSWNVHDIVAVTFTEKAAREMVSRIRREIRHRIEEAEAVEARERWRAHRNALDSARIGPIHSLCAALLRAHSAEAGIDPAFTVLEEIEADMLLEQAIEETLDAAARESRRLARSSDSQSETTARVMSPPSPHPQHPTPDTYHPPLVEIFAYLSAHEVKAALTSLIRQGASAAAAMAHLESKTPADIFTHWQQSLSQVREAAARAIVESDVWRESARTVARLAAHDSADKIEQVRAQVAARLSAINDLPNAAALPQWLLDIKSAIVMRGGSAKKWPSEDALRDVKDALTH